MRRNIKLTGRKDIPRKSFDMAPAASGETIDFKISDEGTFKGHPTNARIMLRMTENKMTEQLAFGTVGLPKASSKPKHSEFRSPSCQLRIVASDDENLGMVLGSTAAWTLKVKGGDDEPDAGQGILDFQTANIAPRIWKLDIRDDEHPIIYVDESIPDATEWARTDPHFHAAILPVIVERVMGHVIADRDSEAIEWADEWIQWSNSLLPDNKAPVGRAVEEREAWLDDLIDAFCRKFAFLDTLRVANGGGTR